MQLSLVGTVFDFCSSWGGAFFRNIGDPTVKKLAKRAANHLLKGWQLSLARWHCFRFFLADLIILGWRTVGAAEDGTEISVIPR